MQYHAILQNKSYIQWMMKEINQESDPRIRQIKAYARLEHGLGKKESKKEDWTDDEKPTHPPTTKPTPESEPHMLTGIR